ncbi:MAG: hypothetical protein HY852_20240 [Bradyrhizobium sp.]|uniref:hypothetical protein n=1 Tax=Bradyrhizobium sp. TaxID=376 RepID=UPI0025B90365|nr:hypothetical protein [Bradyrhizobium sp.]MBI5264138.1 hypothetical protein [Bradyrhizobium sp.]
MAAFTFEKISSPDRRTPIAPAAKKQRGLISQMIDRLAETRARRSSRGEHNGRREGKSGS